MAANSVALTTPDASAAAPLTIRNLTTTAIELNLIERFEAAKFADNGIIGFANITTITKFLSGFMSKGTNPSSVELALKSASFSHQALDIKIRPFDAKITDIQPSAKETLRLTFVVEGQRYRLDTPTASDHSTVLTPLSTNPFFEFTAIYLPSYSYLAIYSSAKLDSWMNYLKDTTPLSALSIPGTHNSSACYPALPSVRCQAVGVREQLLNGVRFLDIRVQPEQPDDPSKDGLILVHSAFPVSLTGNKYLRDIINIVYSFLDANPSETVIISLKREGTGKSTDHHLSKILHDHYATDSSRWFTENRIPTLGEVRNKLVLIRRFALDDSLKEKHNGTGWALDGENWPDNCADGTCGSGDIRIQDFYEIVHSGNIGKKVSYSTDLLERAAQTVCILPGGMNSAGVSTPKQPVFVNFLSASNFWRTNCWPHRIAAKINPSIIDFLCRKHNQSVTILGPGGSKTSGSTGIVVCDWVGNQGDWDLVRCIVGMNSMLQLS